MRLFKRLKGLGANEKGNVMILTAAAMPLIIGSAGLAIDTIQLSLLKRHLQRAVDSGALAGAYTKAQTQPGATASAAEIAAAEVKARAAVSKALGFNNAFPLVGTPTVTFLTTGTHANRAVTVQISAQRKLPFRSFFYSALPTITVGATAALVYSGKYCMISLDEGNSVPGITFGGSADVNLGCGIISNTSGANAINVNSNGNGASTHVTASPIAAVGGVPSNNAYQQPTLLIPYSLKKEDPFASIPTPPPQTGCQPAITATTAPTPAVISGTTSTGGCYRGINLNGAKTLPAGTYFITGDIDLQASANLTGSGVTLVMTHDSDPDSNPVTPPPATPSYPSISINGSATVNLSKPDAGPYKNIIMYYDARAPFSNHTINGNSNMTLSGAFYFPTQTLTFNGNSAMTTSCIQLVAFRLTFEGHTELNNSCIADPGDKTFDVQWVRLVA